MRCRNFPVLVILKRFRTAFRILLFGYNRDKSLREAFRGHFKGYFHRDHCKKFIKFFECHIAVRFFSAAQTHINPNLISLLYEFFNLPRAKFKVVPPGGKADADSFNLHFFLLFSVFPLALFPFILEFAKFHDAANRRVGRGRDFYKVKLAFLRNPEGLGGFQNPKVFAGLVDYADRRGADELIYAVTTLDI